MALASALLVPLLASVALRSEYADPVPPEALALAVTGAGTLIVNLMCAFILVDFKHHSGSLTKADSFLPTITP